MAKSKEAPHPVTLIVGDEDLLVDRAVSRVGAAAREHDPDCEVRELSPETASAGELTDLVQPSLFEDRRVVVVRSAHALGKDAVAALTSYLAKPAPDVMLVLVHDGGKRGKPLLDAAKKAGAFRIDCPKPTKLRDRMDFIRGEVHGASRVITDGGVRLLLDAVGSDLRELASACEQLVADTTGTIDEDTVTRYYQGRAEVSGFTVADRAVEGKPAEALEQLRWALAVGVSPVLITSALAQGLRAIAKVGAASRRSGEADLARELGMPPWKVKRVRDQQLRGWAPEGVSTALLAVAEADARVKGGGADAEYALEKALLEIDAARGR